MDHMCESIAPIQCLPSIRHAHVCVCVCVCVLQQGFEKHVTDVKKHTQSERLRVKKEIERNTLQMDHLERQVSHMYKERAKDRAEIKSLRADVQNDGTHIRGLVFEMSDMTKERERDRAIIRSLRAELRSTTQQVKALVKSTNEMRSTINRTLAPKPLFD